MNREEIRAVKKMHVKKLRSKQNVVSVGTGLKYVGGECTDEMCIVVGVVHKMPPSLVKSRDMIPSHLDGCKFLVS